MSILTRASIDAVVGVRGERSTFVATRGRTWDRQTLDEPILSGRFR